MSDEKCSEKIWDKWTGYPCKRAAKVTRDGKPYCSQHDPEAVAKRRSERNARWDAEAKERAARYARERELQDLDAKAWAHLATLADPQSVLLVERRNALRGTP